MAESSHPTLVMAIAGPGPAQKQINTALSNQSEFHLVKTLESAERLAQEVRAAEPDIILIDENVNGQASLDIIDELGLQFPGTAPVAILSGDDPLRAQQVTLAGARAFLIQPFTQVNLLSTLRRVVELEERHRQSLQLPASERKTENEALQMITLFSPRGGVGCSTIATNLAIALRENFAERVLLFEGKLLFGHLGLILNLRPHNTLADLIPHAGAVDETLVHEVVTRHVSGIDVLVAPPDVQTAQGIRPDDLFGVLNGVKRLYDFIVIDAGSHLSENTVTLMDAADRVLVVTTPELAALHDASRFVPVSRSLGYPPGKVRIVLNRVGMEGAVRSRDIEQALHHELFTYIPEGGASAVRSLNRGIPLIIKHPRSKASKAIERLAGALADGRRPQSAPSKNQSVPAAQKLVARLGVQTK